jgi:peptidoglycan/LPS O-acetylase OafA/YrhL
VILSFIARRDFEWKELLFISNWFTPGHISFLFVWYPQVLLQILAAFFLVFSLPFIPQDFLRRPLAGSLWFLGLAIAAREIDPLLRSGSGSALPHMVAWNFLLGWALFFALRQLKVRDDRSMRALVASGVVASAFWAYGPFALNVWTLSLAGIALVYVPSVSVPSILARLVLILSQAAYAIYLLHVIFLRIYTVVLGFHDPNGAWLFAMLGSTLSWIAGTAFLRAYRKIERERPGRIRAGSAGRFWTGGRAVPEGAPR